MDLGTSRQAHPKFHAVTNVAWMLLAGVCIRSWDYRRTLIKNEHFLADHDTVTISFRGDKTRRIYPLKVRLPDGGTSLIIPPPQQCVNCRVVIIVVHSSYFDNIVRVTSKEKLVPLAVQWNYGWLTMIHERYLACLACGLITELWRQKYCKF